MIDRSICVGKHQHCPVITKKKIIIVSGGAISYIIMVNHQDHKIVRLFEVIDMPKKLTTRHINNKGHGNNLALEDKNDNWT